MVSRGKLNGSLLRKLSEKKVRGQPGISKRTLMAGLFGLTSLVLYIRATFGAFVWDDRMYLTDNDQIQSRSLTDFASYFLPPANSFLDFLPARDWLITLQYHFFGFDPFGYHCVSLVLYAAIAVLAFHFSFSVYKRCSRCLDQSTAEKFSLIAATVCTGIFVLHPVHVEGVAWISGQKELLYVLFSLLAFLSLSRAYEQAPISRLYAFLFVTFYYLSFLCKLTAIGSIIFVPMYWWAFLKKSHHHSLRHMALWAVVNVPVTIWVLYASGGFSGWTGASISNVDGLIAFVRTLEARLYLAFELLALGVLACLVGRSLRFFGKHMASSSTVEQTRRRVPIALAGLVILGIAFALPFLTGYKLDGSGDILRAVRILGAHARLVLIPYPLNFGYPFDPAGFLDAHFFVGLAVVALATASFVFDGRSIQSLGIALFLAYMLPVLQLFARIDNAMIFDRYLFFPLLGVSLITGSAVGHVLLRWYFLRRAAYTVILVAGVVLGALTSQYIPKFSSDVASLEHGYRNFPGWDRVAFELVYALLEDKQLERAEQVIESEGTFSRPIWVRAYFRGWLSLERGDFLAARALLEAASQDTIRGGYYPFPQVHLARVHIELGNLSYAKQILEFVIRQGNSQPLERIKAIRLYRNL